MRRLDLVTGVVTAAVGICAYWDASSLRMFGENHVPGPGFFPKILAGLLCGLGVVLTVMALRHTTDAPVEDSGGEAVTRSGRLRAFAVLVSFGIFAPLVAVIGFVPAMVLLILVVLYGIERRRDFRSLVAAVLIPAASYLLFAHLFAIPLPGGPLMPT